MNNYYTKTSSEIAKVLGVSRAYVNRMASKLGLKRQYNFHKINDEKRQKIIMMYGSGKCSYRAIADRLKLAMSSVATVINEYRTLHPDFKPSNKEENGRKISEARNNLLKSERARTLFGLEQRTDVNIYRCSSKKYEIRCRLRSKGYEIDYGSNDVYIGEETIRDAKLEKRASKIGMTFFVPIGEKDGYVNYEETTI